jgi:hypothetical protein
MVLLSSQKAGDVDYMPGLKPFSSESIRSLSVSDLQTLIKFRDRLLYFYNSTRLSSIVENLDIPSINSYDKLKEQYRASGAYLEANDPLFPNEKIENDALFGKIVSYLRKNYIHDSSELKGIIASEGLAGILDNKSRDKFNEIVEKIKNGEIAQDSTLVKKNEGIFKSLAFLNIIAPVLLSEDLMRDAGINVDSYYQLSNEDIVRVYRVARGVHQRVLIGKEFCEQIEKSPALSNLFSSFLGVCKIQYAELNRHINISQDKANKNQKKSRPYQLSKYILYGTIDKEIEKVFGEILKLDLVKEGVYSIVDDGNQIKDSVISALNAAESLSTILAVQHNYDHDYVTIPLGSDQRNSIVIRFNKNISQAINTAGKAKDVIGEVFIKYKYDQAKSIKVDFSANNDLFSSNEYASDKLIDSITESSDSSLDISKIQAYCAEFKNSGEHKLFNDRKKNDLFHKWLAIKTQYIKNFQKEVENAFVLLPLGLKIHHLDILSKDKSSQSKALLVSSLQATNGVPIKIDIPPMGINGRWEYDQEKLKEFSKELGLNEVLGVRVHRIIPDLEKGDVILQLDIPWYQDIVGLIFSGNAHLKPNQYLEVSLKDGISREVVQKAIDKQLSYLADSLNKHKNNLGKRLGLPTNAVVKFSYKYDSIYSGNTKQLRRFEAKIKFSPKFLFSGGGRGCQAPDLVTSAFVKERNGHFKFELKSKIEADTFLTCVTEQITDHLGSLLQSSLRKSTDGLEDNLTQVLNDVQILQSVYHVYKSELKVGIRFLGHKDTVVISREGISWPNHKGLVKILENKFESYARRRATATVCKGIKGFNSLFGYPVKLKPNSDHTQFELFIKADHDSLSIGKAICEDEKIKIKFLDRKALAALLVPKIQNQLTSLNKAFGGKLSFNNPAVTNNSFMLDVVASLPAFDIKGDTLGKVVWEYGNAFPTFEGVRLEDLVKGRLNASIMHKVKAYVQKSLPDTVKGFMGIDRISFYKDSVEVLLKGSYLEIKLPVSLYASFLKVIGTDGIEGTIIVTGGDGMQYPELEVDAVSLQVIASKLTKPINNLIRDVAKIKIDPPLLYFSPFRIEGTFGVNIIGIVNIPAVNYSLDKSGISVKLPLSVPLPPSPVGPYVYLLDGVLTIDTKVGEVIATGNITAGATLADATENVKIAVVAGVLELSYHHFGNLKFKGDLILMENIPFLTGKGELRVKDGFASYEVSTQGLVQKFIDYKHAVKIDAKNYLYSSQTAMDILEIAAVKNKTEGQIMDGFFHFCMNGKVDIPFGDASADFNTRLDRSGPQSILKNGQIGLNGTIISKVKINALTTYYSTQAELSAFGITIGAEVPSLSQLDPSFIEDLLSSLFDFKVDFSDLESVGKVKVSFSSGEDYYEGNQKGSGGNSYTQTSEQEITAIGIGEVSAKQTPSPNTPEEGPESMVYNIEDVTLANVYDKISCPYTVPHMIFKGGIEIKHCDRDRTKGCEKFTPTALLSKNSNHPKIDAQIFDYSYLIYTEKACYGVSKDNVRCSGLNPTVLDIVLPNVHLRDNKPTLISSLNDKYLMVRAPISTGLLRVVGNAGKSRIYSFVEHDIYKDLPKSDQFKLSLNLHDTIKIHPGTEYKVNLLYTNNNLHLFLSYQLNSKSSSVEGGKEAGIEMREGLKPLVDFTGSFLLTVDEENYMSFINAFKPEYRNDLINYKRNLGNLIQYIKGKNDDLAFRKQLNSALESYMTSLGKNAAEEVNIAYSTDSDVTASCLPDYYGRIIDYSKDTEYDHIDYLHTFSQEGLKPARDYGKLKLNGNGSLRLADDDVLIKLMSLSKKGKGANIDNTREEYVKLLRDRSKIAGKHVMLKALLSIPDDTTIQKAIGEVNQYWLWYITATEIDYLKFHPTESRNSNTKVFTLVRLKSNKCIYWDETASSLTNPVSHKNITFHLTDTAYLYSQNKSNKYLLKKASFSHYSPTLNPCINNPHKAFYSRLNEFLRVGSYSALDVYLDAYPGLDRKHYYAAMIVSKSEDGSNEYQMLWETEGKRELHLSTISIPQFESQEFIEFFERYPKLIDFEIDSSIYMGKRFEAKDLSVLPSIMFRILSGLRKDKVWLRDHDIGKSHVNPLSIIQDGQ